MQVEEWYEANKSSFAPPVCNKLMYKGQLSVMFVGGPNTREDFHVEDGSEFFWQMKGRMELPTMQCGERKLVKIDEGYVFCLPSRVPHSPQRPVQDSLGLVIERARLQDEDDALRFYTDFTKCDRMLWERYFHCEDLGKDLLPVITSWKNSEESKTREPTEGSLPEDKKIVENASTKVPEPFHLMTWVKEHDQALSEDNSSLPLFPGHPDKEFNIVIEGNKSTAEETWAAAPDAALEIFLFQLVGTSKVFVQDAEGQETQHDLAEGACFVVKAGSTFKSTRGNKSRMMRLTQDPRGNRGEEA